ncbi:hypothetical protein EUX98_g1691 [Antrodiella citrinella]|uniref:DASH complex subunit DUO1 n=1 Tax=Antrodiella citrinella TaxID=2447956 RepID=A0A4S4N980_9APHY|nr:hypothetical protein EUX98_g1691 [Antrodiella citrinella]
MDDSDFTLPDSSNAGSRLLSESALFPSGSQQDLSLSDLSINDHPVQNVGGTHRRPFSLLAQPHQRRPLFNPNAAGSSAIVDEEEEEQEGAVEEDEQSAPTPEDIESQRREAARTREERLQHDLFHLRKLNKAFEVYKEALRETKSSTECVADQLEHTDALLNKYMNILAKSGKVTQLMLDERWQGAEADEQVLEEEELAELERRRKEEEERRLAEQRERERAEHEEQERKDREEREEKARLEKERAAEIAATRGTNLLSTVAALKANGDRVHIYKTTRGAPELDYICKSSDSSRSRRGEDSLDVVFVVLRYIPRTDPSAATVSDFMLNAMSTLSAIHFLDKHGDSVAVHMYSCRCEVEIDTTQILST